MLADQSFWHAYLEMLPETDEIGASFTWTQADLELLTGGGSFGDSDEITLSHVPEPGPKSPATKNRERDEAMSKSARTWGDPILHQQG